LLLLSGMQLSSLYGQTSGKQKNTSGVRSTQTQDRETSTFRRVRQKDEVSQADRGQMDKIREQYRARGLSDEEIDRQLERLGLAETDSLGVEKGAFEMLEGDQAKSRLDSLRLELIRLQEEELVRRSELEGEIESLEMELGVEEDLDEEEPMPHFGHDFFTYRAQMYDAGAFGTVSSSYVVGPGDELFFQMWGDTQDEYTMLVDRDGAIYLDQVGKVLVNGLTLEELRRRVARRLSAVYSGISVDGRDGTSFFDLSLGKLRTIRVEVVGAVQSPGAYFIPGLSTVVTALQFADGPQPEGSLRNITVTRQGQIIGAVDLYGFLLSGIKSAAFDLQDGDVVVVSTVEKEVVVNGAVRREPMIYELVADETLETVIDLAGGLQSRAHAGGIQIWRYVSTMPTGIAMADREFIEVNYQDAASRQTVIRDGDSLYVAPLMEDALNYVYIEGEVHRPGMKAFYPGMSLRDLIQKGENVKEDAFLDRALLFRLDDETNRSMIALDLNAYLPEDGNANLILEKRDSLHVYSASAFTEIPIVTIYGEVREEGEYEYYEEMTITDLVFQAGGLKEDAFVLTAEISRLRGDVTETVQTLLDTFYVPLQQDYTVTDDAAFQLQKYDNVFIRQDPNWELQRNVTITGEIQFPGTYSLENRETQLLTLIERAGGFTTRANPQAIEFIRLNNQVGRVPIFFDRARAIPDGNDNLVLMDLDQIHVPEISHTVRVEGEVGFPTSVLYQEGAGLDYYITNAGGFTEMSDDDRIKIILVSGQLVRPRRFWFDSEITPGSHIIVPKKLPQQPVSMIEVMSSSVQILSGLVTTIFILTQTFGK
jgi:protein involved in polysaccharide export with SLBB domain